MIKEFKYEVIIRQDCDEYKDWDIYVDDVEDYDWMFSFFLEKETNEFHTLLPSKSPAGTAEPFEECDGYHDDEVPDYLYNFAERIRQKIITQEKIK